MRRLEIVLIWLLLASAPLAGWSAEAGHEASAPAAGHEEHSLPQYAVEIARPFGFPITNSMLVTWIVAVGLIVFAQVATRKMKHVPDGAQNFWEWMVESLYAFLEGIIGHELVKKTFWFFATIFIFILFSNWVGLIPGVGTIGWGHRGAHGFVIAQPLFRGANADLNMTLAMAMVFFVCWTCLGAAGEWARSASCSTCSRPKGDTTGRVEGADDRGVLCGRVLEVVSILFRPVSLSFRLYGNIFAGENMLESMATAGARGWAGCCRCRFTSWNCWWVWCRRWCSCC